jgi:hypothetical protein
MKEMLKIKLCTELTERIMPISAAWIALSNRRKIYFILTLHIT